MRILITVFILSISINLSAQSWFKESVKGNGEMTTITRNVGDYAEITIAGPFHAKLVKGKEGKLEISVEENLKQYLVTKVKNGKLTIRWDNNFKVKPKKPIHISIPFKEIEGLVMAGSGDVKSVDEISATDFSIKLAGSGSLNLLLSADEVTCTMAGSGNITLVGNSRELDCSKAGSGDFYGYEFTCEDVDIEGAGSGNAEIYVTKVLDAKTAGSGNIYYKGVPKSNNVKVAGSGSIIMK